PMEELSFPPRIGLDQIDAGQLALQPRHPASADAFGLPARDHLVAQGVVAKRGDVIGFDAETCEIDRRVQRVTAKAARVEAARRRPQLDHAFADAGYSCHDRPAELRGELTTELIIDMDTDDVVKRLLGGGEAQLCGALGREIARPAVDNTDDRG